jgi:peptidoglycan/LPS O-acetylase OafA/YrhL
MLLNKGYLFVDLFFVLSGFVIYINYYDKINSLSSFKQFIILRLGRIYPLHILTTIIFLLVPLIEYLSGDYGIGKSQITLSNLLSNFFLIQAWGYPDLFSLNTASWSISTEFFAYLLFGGIILLFRKKSVNCFLLISIIFIYFLFFMDFKYNSYAAISRCIYSFSIGVIISFAYLNNKVKHVPKPKYLIFTMIIFIEIIFRFWDKYEFIVFPILSALLILSLVQFPKNIVTSKFRNPKLLKIGALSYSIYMLHGIVITVYLRLFRFLNIDIQKNEVFSMINSFVLIVLIVISLYFISDYTYNKFEKPIRNRIRKQLKN